ncbi:MAG: hypothetical protein WA047_01965 [Phenylobacterium sp.]|uniref:hypothetical protein n=1 Tax=Phenylobacterium sp. TaxID=1871053 RepID=UPI003BB76F54
MTEQSRSVEQHFNMLLKQEQRNARQGGADAWASDINAQAFGELAARVHRRPFHRSAHSTATGDAGVFERARSACSAWAKGAANATSNIARSAWRRDNLLVLFGWMMAIGVSAAVSVQVGMKLFSQSNARGIESALNGPEANVVIVNDGSLVQFEPDILRAKTTSSPAEPGIRQLTVDRIETAKKPASRDD